MSHPVTTDHVDEDQHAGGPALMEIDGVLYNRGALAKQWNALLDGDAKLCARMIREYEDMGNTQAVAEWRALAVLFESLRQDEAV